MPLFRDGNCPPLRRWSEPAQIAGFAACAVFINLIAGFVLTPLQFTNPIQVQGVSLKPNSLIPSLLMEIFLYPAAETLYSQWLPLFLARFAKRTPLIQILWSATWFAVLHIKLGPAYVLHSFTVGWVLASCFLFSRKESWLKAYRATTLANAAHKAVMLTLYFLFY
ncbi:MAG TPA: hypothetical protein PK878_02195 [bacterium]|nr:hypothetical protein [Candidatus Omnitrophota bacterium]HOJ59074.1 hypothetical protein [bacterium]HOL93286.1 hypothetical protein [bacterium]HPP01333.1 hypothetical protein [bacterium]HXK92434.1 hypothetical protein [bacterium]